MGLSYFTNEIDFHYFAASMIIPWMFTMGTFYWMLEGRRFILKPLLFRMQSEITIHEIELMVLHWNDNRRADVLKSAAVAREQIEYSEIHNDFNSIRAESINRVWLWLSSSSWPLRNRI